MTVLLERARRLAGEVLFPAAADVDTRGEIPASHFTALAEAGLYGIAASDDAHELPAVTEVLAGACLTTTFTWMQHHGTVRALAATQRTALRERYLAAATAGALRCGVALAGALPDPPRLWATRVADGYRLDGEAPLVTGWGLVDLVHVAARDAATAGEGDADAVVVTALLDARPGPGLTPRPLAMLAAQASKTVRLGFDRGGGQQGHPRRAPRRTAAARGGLHAGRGGSRRDQGRPARPAGPRGTATPGETRG